MSKPSTQTTLFISVGVAVLFMLPVITSAATLRTPSNNLGLVGYWSFEGGSGSTATDFSGSGNDGTLTNMDPATDWVSGKRGTALDFGSSTEILNISDAGGLINSNALTISAWMKADKIGTQSNPGKSCKQIFEHGSGLRDGEYWIDPDGSGGISPFKVYCDMTTGSGGWMKIRLANDCNNDNMFWYSKYNGIDDQESVHGKIGNQFNWSYLNHLDKQEDLVGGSCGLDTNQEGFDYVFTGTKSDIHVEWEMWNNSSYKYTDQQMDAIRSVVDEISSTTEAFAHTNDDDGCSQNGEVDLKQKSGGSEYRITHFTSGNQSSEYAIETESEMNEYQDVDYLIPSYIDIRNDGTCSGEVDHGSFGYEKNYTLVRSSTSVSPTTGVIKQNSFKLAAKYNGVSGSVNSTELQTTSEQGWVHTALSYNKNDAVMELYANGEIKKTTSLTESINTNSNDIDIGTKLDGIVDDARLYNRALSASEVRDLYQSGYSQVNSSRELEDIDGLVGWWTMDGKHIDWDAGSDEVKDASGNNNDGTLNGGMSNDLSATKGRMGQALEFDGSGDYISTNVNIGDSGDSISWGGWAKVPSSNSISNNEFLFSNYVNGGHDGFFAIGTDEGDNMFAWLRDNPKNNNVKIADYNPAFDDQWHHYFAVRDAPDDEFRFYIDGELKNSKSFPGNVAVKDSDSFFGMMRHTGGDIPGEIDDVRIYDRAVTGDEIDRIYNATRPSGVNTSQTDKLTDGLVGFWSFDGQDVDLSDSSSEVKDVSGNGNHGDAKNGAKPAIGKLGQGYEFDGLDDYAVVQNDSTLNPDEITVSFWLKVDNFTENSGIIAKGGNNESRQYWIFTKGNGDGAIHSQFNDVDLDLAGGIPTDEWIHFAYIWNSSAGDFTVFQNGESKKSTSVSGNLDSTTDDLALGRLWGYGYFDGGIDNIRIFDRALSQAEIKRLYSLGR